MGRMALLNFGNTLCADAVPVVINVLHSILAAKFICVLFADWVEFSPYEIGMAKYGTFMTPSLFGSKFFMGTVVKQYKENPLHFLMGK